MAVLAPQDWQPPIDPSQNPHSRSMDARNRQPSPDNSNPSNPPPQFHPQTQPYQSQPWQPSPQAPAFYPTYPTYFPQQQPLPHLHHHPHAHPPQPSPYFDPNQHFAQWAYQQMMFNAQAQAQFHAHQQQQAHSFTQTQDFSRSRTPSSNGTPPTPDYGPFQQQQQQQSGFHPYPRRPPRQSSSSTDPTPPQPPYARADAAGSSSSVGSGSSGRSRTGSNPAPPQAHLRSASSGPTSSRDKDRDRRSPSISPSEPPRRAARPSPLGQTYPRERERERAPSPAPDTPTARTSTSTTRPSEAAASKRLSISKDDSQLGSIAAAPTGLKGRLRRALSFNATSTLENGVDVDDNAARGSRRTALAHASKVNAASAAPPPTSPTLTDDAESPPTPTGPPPPTASKSRARRAASLFNTKLNASTDNISLSSTVSSASVMIRKLGSMGRLARKNSLMGITGLFKDKDKNKDKDKDAKNGSKAKKGATAVASVTHATAEIDRAGSSSDGPDISGLSPAAKLARQHTIRSNEEAAARQRAEEARVRDAAIAAAATAGGVGGAPVPVWERNTATRVARRKVLIENGEGSGEEEEEDEGSGSGTEEGSEDGTYDAHQGWEEEDVTIRVGSVQPHPQQRQQSQLDEEEIWAVGLRRSVERTRRPAKGILKNATSYEQDAFLDLPPNTSFARVRSNSYNQAPQNNAEPGPLARIPSPDPDHIDGLHLHHLGKSGGDYIPPFAFEDMPRSESPPNSNNGKGFFNLANMNSSAPALSSVQGYVSSPPLAHRAATTPAKRLAFAPNHSIYDTFSPLVYDRRSEPATCNRLTPALAQRIKEELNSYKMEEMEVHAASRVHTQFFV